MYKKLIMACMALTAFIAFAVAPTSAFAINDPQVTAPTGTALATGSSITGTNEGITVMTDANTNPLTECEVATMNGKLTKNSTGEVEGTIESATFSNKGGAHCSSTFGGITVTTSGAGFTNGLPWCLRSTETMTTDELQVRGGGCGETARAIRFILDSTTIGPCTYERSLAIPGAYTTHPSAAQASIDHVKFDKVAGSFLCPSAGYLDMKFNLTTKGETVFIH